MKLTVITFQMISDLIFIMKLDTSSVVQTQLPYCVIIEPVEIFYNSHDHYTLENCCQIEKI